MAVAALFFILGFIVSVWQAGRASREARAARLNLYVADMNVAQQALLQNNYAYAREKLLAHLPKRGWPDLRGWEWRHLWERCDPDPHLPFVAGDPVHALALSPDGLMVAVARRDGRVQMLDFLRQRFTTNFSAGTGQASQKSIAYSPDGAWLAMVVPASTRTCGPMTV